MERDGYNLIYPDTGERIFAIRANKLAETEITFLSTVTSTHESTVSFIRSTLMDYVGQENIMVLYCTFGAFVKKSDHFLIANCIPDSLARDLCMCVCACVWIYGFI